MAISSPGSRGDLTLTPNRSEGYGPSCIVSAICSPDAPDSDNTESLAIIAIAAISEYVHTPYPQSYSVKND
jgi:hypothetical protein